MKKTLLAAFILAFGLAFQTQAVSTNSNQGSSMGQANSPAKGDAIKNQEQNRIMNKGENNQIQTQEQGADETQKKAAKENKGQINAETHRSVVANFVQSLLTVADREGGIGQQVKVIAQEQNSIKNRTSDLINAVENRSKMKTFFIGTSYKNLGELRSQMVQTRNRIEQLKRLMVEANDQDKIELQNQVQLLEQEQTKIGDFIAQNESKFSLFGWAVKLFRK